MNKLRPPGDVSDVAETPLEDQKVREGLMPPVIKGRIVSRVVRLWGRAIRRMFYTAFVVYLVVYAMIVQKAPPALVEIIGAIWGRFP